MEVEYTFYATEGEQQAPTQQKTKSKNKQR